MWQYSFIINDVISVDVCDNIALLLTMYTAKIGVLKWHQWCQLYSFMVFISGALHNMNTSGVDFNTQLFAV